MVGARGAGPSPSRSSPGAPSGCCVAPPTSADGRATEASDAAEAWVGRLEELGAHVVEADIPGACPRTRGRCSCTRPPARTQRPSRAVPRSTARRYRRSSRRRSGSTPEAVTEGYRALLAWRQLVPEVDLFVSPCVAIDWPPEDADELDVRLPLSSFLRWVNLLGWAALAIGDLQLIAPHDETVLAAGLAWERG